jgi:hypothetical protein
MRAVIQMTIDDAEHYTPQQRADIIDRYPEHEREARVKGIPIFGDGRVFPISEERLLIEEFAIPTSWPQIIGLDFGFAHPFAAVCVAWDRDTDTLYLTREFRQSETTPVIHSAALRPWGDWVPCAWPHDGLSHDKGSGRTLRDQYAGQGLNMILERATFPNGEHGFEAGIMEMLDMMRTGRWRVFKHLTGWLGEFRLYHREDGLIVKVRDDLLSASRYAMMMRRFSRTKPKARVEREFQRHWMN